MAEDSSDDPMAEDSTVDNEFILTCIAKVHPGVTGGTINGGSLRNFVLDWRNYGAHLVSFSEGSNATFLVQNSIVSHLVENLQLIRSAEIHETVWLILGNLASNSTLVDEVASEARLMPLAEMALYGNDIECFIQVLWFWYFVLGSTTGDAWASILTSELNLDQLSHILSVTFSPGIVKGIAYCLSGALKIQMNYMVVIRAFGTKLPKTLIYWLRLLLEGFVPKEEAYNATRACLQMFELLILLVEQSRADIVLDDLFEMLTSFIRSPYKFEVGGGFCVSLACQISEMIDIEPKLIMELSESEVFLEGILDLFQFVNNVALYRISLWHIIEKLLKHTSNRQLGKVFDYRVQYLEEEMIVYQVGENDDPVKRMIKSSVTTIKAYIMNVTDGNIDRLLSCLNKCLVRSFDEACDEQYTKCVTAALSRGCGDDIWDDLKTIVNVKSERRIDDLDAAIMHMELGKKLFPHTLETGDCDSVLKQRKAFDTLIYISTLLFGKASSFLLPWKTVFKITDTEVEFAFSDNAQRLYRSSLSSVGRDIDAKKLMNLREKQKNYGLSDQLAEKMFRDHMCKLVEENISAALSTFVSRQNRQTIEELDNILDFNSRLVNFKKHPDAIRFAPGLGTIVLQGGSRNDDFRLLYKLYAMDCSSSGQVEQDKLAALNQLRDMFGLCEREVATIIAAITPAS